MEADVGYSGQGDFEDMHEIFEPGQHGEATPRGEIAEMYPE